MNSGVAVIIKNANLTLANFRRQYRPPFLSFLRIADRDELLPTRAAYAATSDAQLCPLHCAPVLRRTIRDNDDHDDDSCPAAAATIIYQQQQQQQQQQPLLLDHEAHARAETSRR
ncbi:hypothetical protein ARSEF4850_005726 [Beauveria asiatica]